jgi:hypothetical protein
MLRDRALVLSLVLALGVASCKGTEKVTGNPTTLTELRTLASMLPFLTKSLTAAKAEERFGLPNQLMTTRALVYLYDVEDQKTVSLVFPLDGGVITFARLQDRNGVSQLLPLLD